jgi:hypothetical protein
MSASLPSRNHLKGVHIVVNKQPERFPTVAEFLNEAVDASEKTQAQIAGECGWPRPNVVSMLKTGSMRLPLDKVGPLAESLELDPVHLLWLTLHEYAPDTLAAVERAIKGTLLNEHEREIIAAYREFALGRTVDVELKVGMAGATIRANGTRVVIKPVRKKPLRSQLAGMGDFN